MPPNRWGKPYPLRRCAPTWHLGHHQMRRSWPACGPAALVDDKLVGMLTPKKVEKLIDEVLK